MKRIFTSALVVFILAGCSEEPKPSHDTEPRAEDASVFINLNNKAHTLALTKWCSENQFDSDFFIKKHDLIVDNIIEDPEFIEIEIKAKNIYNKLTNNNKKDCVKLK